MRNKPEIMAPVGGEEQLKAAVRCGADAVYLGGKGFNARRNASNFGETDLKEAVSYCHVRGVKVYVTINTLVMDGEAEKLAQEADYIAASGADAVIIQDLMVLKYFQRHYPSLTRFASTQTAVHNVDGAKLLQDLGFDSIVLARELTLKEIERIATAVPLPMEAFVHGAHCMSVSGACYLSTMFGGRSGNRGLCAQPCRLDWSCGNLDHGLSLKDMSLLPHVQELAAAGVDILKIEGRMKRPEYVASAVTACKNAIEGKPYDVQTLKAVFSRSGFTDGYLKGRRDRTMYGARTKEDVTGAETVFRNLQALYRSETPRVGIGLNFQLHEDASKLTVTDGVRSITVTGDAPQKALTRPLTEDLARQSLEKLGGTPYFLTDCTASIEDGYTLSKAGLNALRRDAVDALTDKRGETRPPRYVPCEQEPIEPYRTATAPALWARFYTEEQIVCADALKAILLPVERVTTELIQRYGEKLIAQLPTLLFPQDEPGMEQHLIALRDAGLTAVYTNNIYGITLAKRLGLKVHGGFGLNVINTAALKGYEAAGLTSLTLSFETAMAAIGQIGGSLPRGIVVYGHLPLMHLRNCPVRAALGCAVCGGRGELTDRKGIAFPVECAEQRYSMLLNSVPLDIAGRALPSLDYRLLYFTREDSQEARATILRFTRDEKTAAPHTTGLYYRDLL